MKTLHLTLLSFLIIGASSVGIADNGQKGREKHDDMHEAVINHRENLVEAKEIAEAKGEVYHEKCPDLVIKKGKRTIVIKCGDAKRDNPECPVCGINRSDLETAK